MIIFKIIRLKNISYFHTLYFKFYDLEYSLCHWYEQTNWTQIQKETYNTLVLYWVLSLL